MLRRCLLFMVSMLLLAGFTGYVSAAEVNIGLVDTKSVFENHPKAQTAKESMEKDIAKFQDIFQAKQEEIKALKEKLDSATLLSDEEKEKQKKVINDKIAEIMQYKEDVSAEIEANEQRLTKEIIDDIYAAISEIAKNKNLQLVIEKGSTLYAATGLDLTNDVMEMIEKKNQKSESKRLEKN